jgi:predicted PhzF superfamily epimerase YddE/YHI9
MRGLPHATGRNARRSSRNAPRGSCASAEATLGWPSRHRRSCATDRVDEALVQRIATLLGIDRREILDAAWADNGPGWVAVLLEDAGAVLAARPGAANLDLGIVGAYPPGSPEAFEVRAFFPKDGVLVEDPVTGSLNAGIAPWLLRTGRATAPYVVSQGTLLGRAGRVHVERDDDGRIWVGGATATCVSGEVEL